MPKQNLREHLDQSGETQQEFAARVGVTQSYVSRILAGERVPSLQLALRIANAAEIPVASLVDTSAQAVAS